MYIAYAFPAVGLVYTLATTVYMIAAGDINTVLILIGLAFVPGISALQFL